MLHAIWLRICKEYDRIASQEQTEKKNNRRLNRINRKQNATRPCCSHLRTGCYIIKQPPARELSSRLPLSRTQRNRAITSREVRETGSRNCRQVTLIIVGQTTNSSSGPHTINIYYQYVDIVNTIDRLRANIEGLSIRKILMKRFDGNQNIFCIVNKY
jgi:hypothetical protein